MSPVCLLLSLLSVGIAPLKPQPMSSATLSAEELAAFRVMVAEYIPDDQADVDRVTIARRVGIRSRRLEGLIKCSAESEPNLGPGLRAANLTTARLTKQQRTELGARSPLRSWFLANPRTVRLKLARVAFSSDGARATTYLEEAGASPSFGQLLVLEKRGSDWVTTRHGCIFETIIVVENSQRAVPDHRPGRPIAIEGQPVDRLSPLERRTHYWASKLGVVVVEGQAPVRS